MNKYEIIGIVGEGAYGVVYKAKEKESGQFVAVKKFKESDEDEIARKTIMREVRMLRLLNHQNIVKLYEAFKRKGRLYLVFEYIDKNLLEVLEENICGIDPKRLRLYVYQMIKGVCFCHRSNVVHRDIKPENLLINPADSSLKICDFGFSRPLPQNFKGPRLQGGKMTDYVATRWYRSPELLLGYTDYGPEVDMWAIGCIMGELSDGQPLFPGDSEMDMLYLFQKIIGSMTKEQQESFSKNPRFVGLKFPEITKPETLEKKYMTSLSKKALQLMCGLLKMDPAERLTSEQALMHVYFDDIREPEVEQELKALVTPVTRPIYSSQSRITSYGQKFGGVGGGLQNQNQLIAMTSSGQNHQRSTNSTSKDKATTVSSNGANTASSTTTGQPLKTQQSYMANKSSTIGNSSVMNTQASKENYNNSVGSGTTSQQQQQQLQQQLLLNNCTVFGMQMSKRMGGGPMTSSHASSDKGGVENHQRTTIQAQKTYSQQQKVTKKGSKNSSNNASQIAAQQQIYISKPSGTSHMNQREKKLFEIYSSQGGQKNVQQQNFTPNTNAFIQSKNQSMTCYNLTGNSNNNQPAATSYEYSIDGASNTISNNYFNNQTPYQPEKISKGGKSSNNQQQIQLQNQRISYGGPQSEMTSYQSEKRLKEYNHKNKLAHSRQQFIIEEEPTYSQRSSSDETKKPRNHTPTPNSKLVTGKKGNKTNSVGVNQQIQGNNTLNRNSTNTEVNLPHTADMQNRTNSQSNNATSQGGANYRESNFNGDTGHDYNSSTRQGHEQNSKSRGPPQNRHPQQQNQHKQYVSVVNQQQPQPNNQYRDQSQGANSNHSSKGSVLPNQQKQGQKFINASSRMVNNQFNHHGATSQASQRGINDLLVESQKMIYAPTRGSNKQSSQQSFQSQAPQVSIINMNNRKKKQQEQQMMM